MELLLFLLVKPFTLTDFVHCLLQYSAPNCYGIQLNFAKFQHLLLSVYTVVVTPQAFA